jgi:hypothetical protein
MERIPGHLLQASQAINHAQGRVDTSPR